MRTSARIVGAAVVALALTGAGSTAFASDDGGKDPVATSTSGDGGNAGNGGIGLNLLCGINGTCSSADGGAGGASSSEASNNSSEG